MLEDSVRDLRLFMNKDINSMSLKSLNSIYSTIVELQCDLRKYVQRVSKARLSLILKDK